MLKKPWRSATGSTATESPGPRASLVRSQTGSKSIRGRISSPIPIPNPLDDDYPMPMSNAPSAAPTTAPNPDADDTAPDVPAAESPAPTSTAPQTTVRTTIFSDRSQEPDKTASTSTYSTTVAQPITPQPRNDTLSGVRYSLISAESGTEQSSNSKENHQRKKSTLRGALGRLFGRRKNTPSTDTANARLSRKPPSSISAQQPEKQEAPSNGEQKRSVSLPVAHYDRALRSHSIGPDDVMAIESVRNSLVMEMNSANRRPRVADSFPAPARRMTEGQWTGLSPRPFSGHGRNFSVTHKISDPENIGRAITCDNTTRRRSRSLSGLVGVEEDQNDPRSRSDEIRYWRESYNPHLGELHPPTTAGGDDPVVTPPDATDSGEALPPATPLQPFSFSHMNELAGMKITQAASMETRIGSLESRVKRMEQVVAQVCNTIPDFKPQTEVAAVNLTPKPGANSHLSVFGASHLQKVSTRPSTQHSNSSRESFGDAPTFVGSLQTSNMNHSHFESSQRPVSTTTIRAAASLPSLSKDFNGPFTIDHFTTLTALLETERAARLALEAQVKSLGHQMAIITKRHTTSLEGVPRVGDQVFANRSAFDDDDDDDEDEQKRISHTRRSGHTSLEDSGIAAGDTEDEDVDDFITPHEEVYKSSAFDNDGDGNDFVQRKTARTMSLSQMTVAKSPRKPYEAAPPMI
jgi:hypothetical protein